MNNRVPVRCDQFTYDVVMRCKDEISSVQRVIDSIKCQSKKPKNIIFVDNGSTDGSLDVANASGCEIVNYGDKPYNYSRALNIGCTRSTSEFILLISAHCEIVDNGSVEALLNACSDAETAASFGRQIPTIYSKPTDIRDLITVFGREKIVYRKYPFFHNAFSLIKREVWAKIQFDQSVNGIEDRVWARAVCRLGYNVVYEPDAVVFHEHGLNQDLNQARALRVCKALEFLHQDDIIKFPSFK